MTDIMPLLTMGKGFLYVVAKGVRSSMDGKGRWVDNAVIERPLRGVKCEDVCLHACAIPSEANTALERDSRFSNPCRPHQGLGDLALDEAYF